MLRPWDEEEEGDRGGGGGRSGGKGEGRDLTQEKRRPDSGEGGKAT